MAELTPSERLQPCLLDRLTDERPQQKQESREQRVVSMRQYRQAVLRDLGWLLNAGARPAGDEIYETRAAADSVLNFGIRDLSGLTAAGIDPAETERTIARAVEKFEPRIVPSSLSVKCTVETGRVAHNAITFEIRGTLWAQPLPDNLFVKTRVDLETGHCDLIGSGNG
jgi:type VI secretion system protein ImpF